MRPALIALALILSACPTPPFEYPPGPPQIVRFDASPLEIEPGGQVDVRWKVERADRVDLSGEPVAAEGSTTITATTSRKIVLEARGPGGSSRAELSIAVRAIDTVAIESFAVVPARVRPFELVTLVWRTRGAVQVDLREVGAGPLLENAGAEGTLSVRVAESATFELRADGPGGPISARANVVVMFDPPLVELLRLDPPLIRADEVSALHWTVRDATWIQIFERTALGEQLLFQGTDPSGTLQLEGRRGTRIISLHATGPGGETNEALTLEVIAAPPPEITRLELDPSITGIGGDVRVFFRVLGADVLTLFLGTEELGTIDPGAEETIVRVADTTALLSLIASGSGTATRTATITVDPTWPIVDRLEIDDQFDIYWSVEQTDRVTFETETGAFIATSTSAEGSIRYRPGVDQILRFTATSTRGTTQRFLPIEVGP